MFNSWAARAYASLNGLSNWYADLLLRIKELEAWTAGNQIFPKLNRDSWLRMQREGKASLALY